MSRSLQSFAAFGTKSFNTLTELIVAETLRVG